MVSTKVVGTLKPVHPRFISYLLQQTTLFSQYNAVSHLSCILKMCNNQKHVRKSEREG